MQRVFYRFPFLILVAAVCLESAAHAQTPLKVVTTLSSYASIAQSIGGERVAAVAIASPRFNPHFIEPRPSDILKLKRADLFIHSGLDLEAWRDPMVDAAARPEIRVGGDRQLDLSSGIALLEVPSHPVSRAEGDIHIYGNPHYWIDPRNGVIIAQMITKKLQALDPEHGAEYEARGSTFEQTLRTKIDQWRAALAPYSGQELIAYHNEWIYFSTFAGMRIANYLEPKPGVPPTPKQVKFLIAYAKERHIRAIIQPSYFPREAADHVAEASGAKVVVLCQNVEELPDASDYIAMIDFNVRSLVNALRHD